MIKAVIFDCFGVITSDGLELLIKEKEAEGFSERHKIAQIVEQVNNGEIHRDVSSAKSAALLGLSHQQYSDEVKSREVRNYELLEYITDLRGNYKTALLTNISRPSLDRRFTKQELTQYFDVQIVSGELGYGKPDPRIYAYALKQLSVAPAEAVFIDDRQPYLSPAKAMGINTILFEDNKQLFSDLSALLG